MPARTPDAADDAHAAINGFLEHLAERGHAPQTLHLRRALLTEYLEHTLTTEHATTLTPEELMAPERAQAWLTSAAAGRTRRRNTLRGPDAAAAPNSQRARIQTWNALAAHLHLPHRLALPAPEPGDWLDPHQAQHLLHTLAVKRPTGANAATSIRTAAVAALVAATGRTVPQLHRLNTDDIDLEHRPLPRITLDTGPHPLDKNTADILRRWLDVRAHITAQLQGSDPGYLWIPTKPGRPRAGVEPPPPGLTRAAVRTLHAAHRTLVMQVFGHPLPPGALLPRT